MRRHWDVVLDEPVRGSAVIDADGTVYVATSSALHAVDEDGSRLWEVPIQLPEEEPPSPAIGLDGAIYIRNGGALEAYDAAGDREWSIPFDGIPLGSPVVGDDGRIHLSVVDLGLVAIDADGTVGGVLDIEGSGRYSLPGIGRGRTWVAEVDSFGAHVWAFGPDGDQILSFGPVAPVYGYQAYPVVADDGGMYLATDGALIAFDDDGTERWRYERATNNFGPAIGADGTLYFASGGALTALTSDGSTLWALPDDGRAADGVAIAPDGSIWVSGEALLKVDAAGTIVEELELEARVSSRLAVDTDGTVVFGTSDGVLHAR